MYKKIALCAYVLLIFHTSLTFNSPFQEAPLLTEDFIAEFVILTASYNNEKYCEENLASIAFQKSSKPYHIIIINDCSTDKTGELLERFIHTHQLESKVTLIHNTKRCYSLENIYTAIHNHIEDHKIVVSVDGDDLLSSDHVLLRLEQEYKTPHIHLTYGSQLHFTDRLPSSNGTKVITRASKIPDNIIRNGKIRTLRKFIAGHLKTFRAGLFKQIKKEDLMYEGKFLQITGDVAFMYPMIDMLASPRKDEPLHVSFIPDILYLWNNKNPINDYKKDSTLQQRMRNHILTLKPYSPIDTTLLKHSPQIKHNDFTLTH